MQKKLKRTKNSKLTKQERQKHINNKACFKCREVEHFAKECTKGGQQSSRKNKQLAIITVYKLQALITYRKIY